MRTFDQVLPAELPGGWKRGPLRPASETPPLAQDLGVQGSAQATYEGQGTIQVRAFLMKSETSAFELMQKWRQVDGIGAYKGTYFFVANADGVPRDAVMSLLADLQRLNSVA